MSRKAIILVVAALAGALLLLAAEPALAAGTSGIGKNLGDEVTSWGKNLMFAVAGISGIFLLGARKHPELGLLILMATLLGGFFWAPGSIEHVITSIWNSVAG
jgi:hypothetical protein